MNDICRDTALVRLSDQAGFETEDEKKRPRPEPLNKIIDETTTQDELLEILERAFFTCRINDDGDIVVRDVINFYIHPAADGLLLTAIFDFREGMDREAMRAVARAANSGDWLGRFRTGDEVDYLRAEHYIVLKGGITVRNFGQTLRRYANVVFQQMRGVHREVIA